MICFSCFYALSDLSKTATQPGTEVLAEVPKNKQAVMYVLEKLPPDMS